MSFASHFPKETFALFVNNIKDKLAKRITASKETDRYWEVVGNEFSGCFESYLKDLRQQGRLNTIDGLDSMELRSLSAWNRFVNNETKEGDWAIVNRFLAHNFVFIPLCPLQDTECGENVTTELIEQAYQAVIDTVNKGDIPACFFASNDQFRITGQKVFYELKDWVIGCHSMDEKANRIPSTPPEVPSIKINTITLETGHLIMADWIDIKEFTGAIDDDDYSREMSINYAGGREKQQERIAKQFNFSLIYADYYGTTIYEKDGVFMAGFVDDEFDEDRAEAINLQFNNHGDVHTDGVSFTIIEKENLIRIIEQAIGHEKAIELVGSYLTERKGKVLEINVAPGTYYCYSMGDYEGFAEHLDEYDHPFAGIDRPVFVFGNRELELVSDLAVGPATM